MDIDIDIAQRVNIVTVFPQVIRASIVEKNELKPHICGVYFQSVPVDKISNVSAIPYDKTESYGYCKIDFLHLSLLNNFTSKPDIRRLLKKQINWQMLEDKNIVSKLFHISKNYELVNKIKPKSIEELADVLALIRPSKIELVDSYIKNKQSTRIELYKKTEKSDLRKSHAIPYALLITLQMKLIEGGNYET